MFLVYLRLKPPAGLPLCPLLMPVLPKQICVVERDTEVDEAAILMFVLTGELIEHEHKISVSLKCAPSRILISGQSRKNIPHQERRGQDQQGHSVVTETLPGIHYSKN